MTEETSNRQHTRYARLRQAFLLSMHTGWTAMMMDGWMYGWINGNENGVEWNGLDG